MKNPISPFVIPPILSTGLYAALLLSFSFSLAAQPPASNRIQVQRLAMRKLSSLAGHWSGPASIFRGSGKTLRLTQTEDVAYKLDGLVMLIEGKSTNARGKTLFNALATIAYDDTSHTYRFRAYNGGHYLDTEISVLTSGFSWSFNAGPAHIVNTMHLTGKGEWNEVTDVSRGSNPPHRSMDMLLQRMP